MVATDVDERYTFKHRPIRNLDIFDPRCVVVLPSGETCNRRINWVDYDLEYNQSGATGHWRHNPRPYKNY